MIVNLKDAPGELIKVLKHISANHGNIISIVHYTFAKTEKGIPVQIIFEIDHEKFIENIKKELMKNEINVSKINVKGKEYYVKKGKTILMIGHIIDKNIKDTIDRINNIGLVTDLDIVMPSPEKKSNVFMCIEYDENKEMELEMCLKQISEEKEFLLIEEQPVEGIYEK